MNEPSRVHKDPNGCPQCWQVRDPASFIGKRGKRVRWCAVCRGKYKGYEKLSPLEKLALPRRGVERTTDLRARLVLLTHDRKLGGIPSSMTSRSSCPESCSLYQAGCYAEFHLVGYHWRRVGEVGDDWDTFVGQVARLPPGQLWRHNMAGDLPGAGERIHGDRLRELVAANRGKRGFTFTHKHKDSRNMRPIYEANRAGFTVNLSADDVGQADRLASLGIAPVAVLLPSTAPDRAQKTPAGRTVVVCPAQRELATCASCQLCAKPTRKAIVGFRAHGQAAAQVDHLLTLRRKG